MWARPVPSSSSPSPHSHRSLVTSEVLRCPSLPNTLMKLLLHSQASVRAAAAAMCVQLCTLADGWFPGQYNALAVPADAPVLAAPPAVSLALLTLLMPVLPALTCPAPDAVDDLEITLQGMAVSLSTDGSSGGAGRAAAPGGVSSAIGGPPVSVSCLRAAHATGFDLLRLLCQLAWRVSLSGWSSRLGPLLSAAMAGVAQRHCVESVFQAAGAAEGVSPVLSVVPGQLTLPCGVGTDALAAYTSPGPGNSFFDVPNAQRADLEAALAPRGPSRASSAVPFAGAEAIDAFGAHLPLHNPAVPVREPPGGRTLLAALRRPRLLPSPPPTPHTHSQHTPPVVHGFCSNRVLCLLGAWAAAGPRELEPSVSSGGGGAGSGGSSVPAVSTQCDEVLVGLLVLLRILLRGDMQVRLCGRRSPCVRFGAGHPPPRPPPPPFPLASSILLPLPASLPTGVFFPSPPPRPPSHWRLLSFSPSHPPSQLSSGCRARFTPSPWGQFSALPAAPVPATASAPPATGAGALPSPGPGADPSVGLGVTLAQSWHARLADLDAVSTLLSACVLNSAGANKCLSLRSRAAAYGLLFELSSCSLPALAGRFARATPAGEQLLAQARLLGGAPASSGPDDSGALVAPVVAAISAVSEGALAVASTANVRVFLEAVGEFVGTSVATFSKVRWCAGMVASAYGNCSWLGVAHWLPPLLLCRPCTRECFLHVFSVVCTLSSHPPPPPPLWPMPCCPSLVPSNPTPVLEVGPRPCRRCAQFRLRGFDEPRLRMLLQRPAAAAVHGAAVPIRGAVGAPAAHRGPHRGGGRQPRVAVPPADPVWVFAGQQAQGIPAHALPAVLQGACGSLLERRSVLWFASGKEEGRLGTGLPPVTPVLAFALTAFAFARCWGLHVVFMCSVRRDCVPFWWRAGPRRPPHRRACATGRRRVPCAAAGPH